MGRFIRRLLFSVLTLALVSLLVFAATEILPGDVASSILGKNATPDAVAALQEKLGLDRPAFERYLTWVGGLLTGDLGESLTRGQPITDFLGPRVRNTLILSLVTVVIGVPLSLLLGVIAGLRRDTASDFVISTVTLLGISMPEFVVGTIFILVFAIGLGWFPAVTLVSESASVAEILPAVWLPAFTLIAIMMSYIARMVRGSVIDTMQSDYIEFTSLKGVARRRVVMRHALPNALVPAINVIGLNLAWVIGGVVVVETVFNYPGIGTLTVGAVQQHDLPLIQTLALLSAAAYILINLSADVLSSAVNPRLRKTI